MSYYKGITLRKHVRRTSMMDRVGDWFDRHPNADEIAGGIILGLIVSALVFIVGVMWFAWCWF